MLDRIYIPTLGRITNQITYNGLPDQWKKITYLVVQPHEYEEAKSLYPNVLCLPPEIKGIANTRKWIVEQGKGSYYVMMDDDMYFLKRNVNRQTKKKIEGKPSKEPFTSQDYDDMLGEMATRWFTEGVTVGGLTFYGMFPKDFDEKDHGIIIQCFLINGHTLPIERLDWSVPYGEDHHFVLQVLKMKLKTRITDKYLFKSKEWAEGGCQDQGRTAETDKLAHEMLIEKHPGIVEWTGRTRKHSKGHIQGIIRINWKKCYNYSESSLEEFL